MISRLTPLVLFLLTLYHAPLLAQTPGFQQLFSQHSAVMLLINPITGQIVDANPSAAEFYGFPREDLKTKTIQQINLLSDKQVAAERALATREGRNYFIFRHTLASGEIRTVEVYSHPFIFDEQQLLLSVIHDITPGRNLEQGVWHYQQRLEELVAERTKALETRNHWVLAALLLISILACILFFVGILRKRAETALAYRQGLFSAIFEQSGFLAGVLDRDGCLREVNQRALQQIGLPASAVIGHQFVDTPWWTEADKPHLRKVLSCAQAGQAASFEATHPGLNGLTTTVLFHALPVTIGNTQYISVIGVDISEKKHVEEALLDTKQAAEAANIAKSRFLATMSHEIRTPMNGILGMAQLLLGSSLSEAERHQCSRTILHSGQTLLTLLNDILDLSKVEAGKLSLDIKAVDPQQMLDETIALFADSAKAKGLHLDATWVGPDAAHYLSDPHRLQQMLSNLVNNAIKFTAQGEIHLTATVLSNKDGATLLEFVVTDTGIGICAEQQTHLFKPFCQADNSTTRQFGGTGLGLSIVRSLARLMGGEAGVQSQLGQGSRFWFHIRTERATTNQDHCQPTAQNPDVSVLEENYPQLQGRVLIVEDNPTNQLVLNALLPKLGLETALAKDGSEAVDALIHRGEKFNAILMDLQMPVMDGYEATQHIRAWEKSNQQFPTPIIALTADAFPEDRKHCLSLGMDDFMAKPVMVESLLHALGRFLKTAPSVAAQVTGPQQTNQPLDREHFLALANALLPMLAQGKFDAIDRFSSLEALGADTWAAASLCKIRQSLDNFHFHHAQEALTHLIHQLSEQDCQP